VGRKAKRSVKKNCSEHDSAVEFEDDGMEIRPCLLAPELCPKAGGLIQSGSRYGSGSSNLAQSGSGSTKSLNPDPIRIRIRIHNRTLEDKFFQRFKNEH
jgi:hypothetical protein